MIWGRKRKTQTVSGEVSTWERELVEKVVTASLTEGRRARRWGIFFKLLTFAYLIVLLVLLMPDQWPDMAKETDEHTALVEIKGVIAPGAKASADNVVTGLRDAYEDDKTKGIILRINSPGGSPVQAGYINDEIRRLRKEHPDTPVYAVISDICASGGYYVASAADKIYADKASIVGSIGVRMDGFGFVDTIEKLGIERRLVTAGEHKAFLDPFLPSKPADVEHIETLLVDIHDQFINAVKDGRGDRLKETEDLFSGLIWTGDQSVEIGLVDELASASQVARDVVGAEFIVDFSVKPDFFERFSMGISAELGRFLVEKTLTPQLR